MNQPMVTTVTPVYNAEKYLDRCIESLLDQGYKNLEIVLIDDGSTDHSAEICRRYSEKDSRIRYIRQSNKGVSAARNLGLENASGEFVTFVDADDMLRPNAIEAMVMAVHENTDLVIGSYERFRCKAGQDVVNSSREFSRKDIMDEFAELDKLIDFPWGRLFRRSVICGNDIAFDKNIPYGEDHVFNIAFCCCARSVRVISDVVYRYRLGGMASSVKYHPNMHQLNLAILTAYEKFSCEVGRVPAEYLRQKIRDQLCGTIVHYLCHCDSREAIRKIEETLDLFARYIDENYMAAELYSSDMRESILAHDAHRIVRSFVRSDWKQIILKRVKLFCYKTFKYKI